MNLLTVARVSPVLAVCALVLAAPVASGATSGAPVATRIPVVHGQPGLGKQLKVTNGNWDTGVTLSYQWLRCAIGHSCLHLPSNGSYSVIRGATAASYQSVPADVGHVLVAKVTATNPAGSTTVFASRKAPVEARAPGVKHIPTIKGTSKAGKVLVTTGESWSRSPYNWDFQWLRCSSSGNSCLRIKEIRSRCSSGSCFEINLGTSFDYTLTTKDVGHRLRVEMTAWNGAGHTTATSSPTGLITK